MSRNFHRACSLSLQGSSSRTISGGGDADLRITFEIEASTIQSPAPACFRIVNPSPATVAQFQNREFQTLEFSAGYVDNMGLIYVGDIKEVRVGKSSAVDTYVDIYTYKGGSAQQQSRVGTTLAAGHTPMDRVNMALAAMAPFGVKGLGLVNVDLSQPVYPRGRAFVGMARDVLRSVALSAGANWNISNDGRVNIVDVRKPIQSGGAFVLNSQTGMVGIPEQATDCIRVRSLINPALDAQKQVQIAQQDINRSILTTPGGNNPYGHDAESYNAQQTAGLVAADGLYTIVFMTRRGDTRGPEWYDDLTCVATTAGKLTKPQIEQGATMPIMNAR